MTRKSVLGAAIGPCVHIAGLEHFLGLCEEEGWSVASLGPAVPVDFLLSEVLRQRPDLVAVSYRLTAEDLAPLVQSIERGAQSLGFRPRWVFGGTPPTAEVALKTGLFEKAFDGAESPEEVLAFIRGTELCAGEARYPGTLLARVESRFPIPLLRHHYGEPELGRTIEGARRIADAGVLDVLSIGPDQNAQEHFFHPEEMDPGQDGAGGVPLRRPEDLAALFEATRRGNYPLLRCYSGTRDLTRWAEMSLESIRIAWGAIPLCWYSVMDGRSKVPFPQAIQEKQEAMRWYAERRVPVEVNESHQWSLRDAHDSLAVAMAFLAAYNAKAQGVRDYVIQMMHNTPPSTSPAMDLAKMLAKLALIGEIEGTLFRTLREVRAGITSLPSDMGEAKGHMASSAVFSMALKPHILHVVGFSEATRVVDPDTLIESCRIAKGAVRMALQGAPDPTCDPAVQARKEHLVREARVLLEGVRKLGPGSPDPWSDAGVLTEAIRRGLLDAPHFRGNPHLFGKIVTACKDGGWEAIDPLSRHRVSEADRLRHLGVEV